MSGRKRWLKRDFQLKLNFWLELLKYFWWLKNICTFADVNERQTDQTDFRKQVMRSKMTTATLNYSTREINRTFKIKVYGYVDGRKIDTLVGVSGLLRLIGAELANKMLAKAFRTADDKQICKLRRGIKVTFYYY